MGKARDQVGGGRRHQNRIGPARQFDVAHRCFGGLVPQGAPHRPPGQRLEGLRGDEAGSVLGEHYLDLGAGLAQAPHQVGGFVRGDAAADAEQATQPLQ